MSNMPFLMRALTSSKVISQTLLRSTELISPWTSYPMRTPRLLFTDSGCTTHLRQKSPQFSKHRFTCGNGPRPGRSGKMCGIPSYSSQTTATPCSAARLAITLQPSRTDSSPQANHIGGEPVHFSAMAGLTNGWQSARPSQYASVRGGCVGQIAQGGKSGAL